MRTSVQEIRLMLKKAEESHGLPAATLERIYLEEARVVYKGNRRDVFKNLRDILSESVKGSSDEN